MQGFGKKILDRKYGKSIVSSKADEDLNINLQDKALMLFYNYCYWYGYFYDESKVTKVLKLVFKDLFNYLNLQRYQILKKFQK